MGILSKIMFWKKGEEDFGDLGLGGEELGLGKDLTGMEGVGAGKMPGFGETEHFEGAEKPLGAAPGAPKTEEVSYPGYGAAGPYGAPAQPAPSAPQPDRRDQIMIGKELELISAKLDSLKISMDSLNMRVASLERIARGDYEKTW